MELYLRRRLSDNDTSSDEKQWVRFPIDGSLTVGRSANCGLRLSSIHVSRNHATLKRSTEGFMVRDQKSLLGIHVNGVKIPAESWHTLKSGDEIEFGKPEEDNASETLELNDRFVYLVKQASAEVLDLKARGPSCHVSPAFEKMLAGSSLMKRKLAPSKAITAPKHGYVKNTSDNLKANLPHESEILKENKRLKLMLKEKEIARENNQIPCNSGENEEPKDPVNMQKDCVSKVESIQTSINANNTLADSPISEKITEVRSDLEKSIRNLKEEMIKRKIFIIKPVSVVSTGGGDAKVSIHEQESDNGQTKDIKAMEEENERLKLELEKKEQELKKEFDIRNQKLEEEQKKIAEELENDIKLRYDRREELETRLMLEKDIAIEECEAKIQEKEKASTSIESVVNTMENELQCSICSELFVVSTTLNCAHTFCEYCIMEWRNVRDICPVCRQPIETVTRSLVLDNYIDKVLESLSSEKREVRMKLIKERKQLVIEKKNSRNSGNSWRGSHRGQSRGRGNNSRLQNSRIRVVQPRAAILISSESSSSGSDMHNDELGSDDSDDMDPSEYHYYYDPRYRRRRY